MESFKMQTNDREDGYFHLRDELFRHGGLRFPNYKVVFLCLGLLNAVLFITAVVLGVKCARVREGSLHVSHSAALELFSEIDDLRSNHSDVIRAKEEAKSVLDRAIKNHTQLKEQTEQQKIINDAYQKQIEELMAEKQSLQSNISALEGNCGRCLSGWLPFNSSCYFFSHTESKTVKKNWPDSRADCIRRGSDLVVIDNPEEQIFVIDTIDHIRGGDDIWKYAFWIGLTDTETEGTWTWVNNVTEVEQRYWMDGEPNNTGPHREDCGVVAYSADNPWKTRFDENCLRKEKLWICEKTSS